MSQVVLIAHAEGEEEKAELIAKPLRRAGYDVSHRGTVLVGESITEEASKLLYRGSPVVLCATVNALGTGWVHRLVQSAQPHKGVRVFFVRMDRNAYLDQITADEKIAEYWQDPEQAIEQVIRSLRKHFPVISRDTQSDDRHWWLRSIEALQSAYDQTAKSRHPCHGATAKHVDWNLVEQFAPNEIPLDSRSERSRDQQLETLGLTTSVGNEREMYLHRAAVLCFCREPQAFYPSARSVLVVGELDESEIIRNEITGPLSEQIIRLVDLLASHLRPVSSFRDGRRFDLAPVPIDVVREVVSNAVAHRDYDASGFVQVRITRHELIVTNPGSFPSDAKWQTLLDDPVSIPTSAEITHYLSKLRTAEGLARGFSVFRSFRQTEGHNSIKFEELAGPTVRVRIKRKPTPPVERSDDDPRPEPDSNGNGAPVIPQGLRSFGHDHSDFYSSLLPPPYREDGTPESIWFWETQIKKRDNQSSFGVGVLFGPSGCGKTSFLRAGLLPRLSSENVQSIYVQALSDGTETRLLTALRDEFPIVPRDLSLPQVIKLIQDEVLASEERKVLIVIDQFEQWLHANPVHSDVEPELLLALKRCDGTKLQCIVAVRDDFWLAISRCMSWLGQDLREGENVRRLDRFARPHARAVLARFGAAYGRLPSDLHKLTAEQNDFLDDVVYKLSEGEYVIPLRLTLFAEIFKDRPWTHQELDKVGGIVGAGEAFLDASFGEHSSSPEYQIHTQAASAVLGAMLPDIRSSIRGHFRSQNELLKASGYSGQQDRFKKLIAILDQDLRLITPAETEQTTSRSFETDKTKYYHLTHDYLVPSIRSWLAKTKQETFFGRLELRLEKLTANWERNQHSGALSVLDCVLVVSSLRRNMSPDEKAFVNDSLRRHGFRLVMFLLLLSVAFVMGLLM